MTMKNIIGILCAIALCVLAGSAAAREMYAGVKGGVNIASLSGDTADNLDSKNGFIGGAFYGVNFSDGFGGRLEALYVMGGAEGEFVVPGEDHGHESTVTLDYVQFPLLFVVNVPASEKVVFNFALGPTFSFNTTAEVEDHEHGETVDISGSVNGFEFGGLIGGGVAYKLSSMSLLLDARYSMGATNVVDAEPSDVKNRGIGVMAGLSFPLGSN
jgi:Outer membrane protein beta-barrel domain